MVSTSVNLPPAMLRAIEQTVDESNVYESRSHYVRAAIRAYRDDTDDEFSKAA